MGDFIRGNKTIVRLAVTHEPDSTGRDAGELSKTLAHWAADEHGGLEWTEQRLSPTAAGITITTSSYTSVDYLFLKNLSPSVAMWIEFYYAKGAYAAGELAISQANPDTIVDSDGGNFSTTPEFAEAGDYAFLDANAEDAGNKSTYHLIQALADSGATKDQLTLAQDSTITANTDDEAAGINFVRKCKLNLPAGKMMVIPDVWPTGNISVKSQSGTLTNLLRVLMLRV